MLRLVHAFCEATPMLLLQVHIFLKDADLESANELLGVTPEPTIDEPSGKCMISHKEINKNCLIIKEVYYYF